MVDHRIGKVREQVAMTGQLIAHDPWASVESDCDRGLTQFVSLADRPRDDAAT